MDIFIFFSDFSKYNTCGSSFLCDNRRCIDEDLICDHVDHCGDYSDEAEDGEAACKEPGKFHNHRITYQIREGSYIIFFLFLHKKIYCGYSLEAPRWGASNEYPQHMFLWQNKKNISMFWLEKSTLYGGVIYSTILLPCNSHKTRWCSRCWVL